MSRSIDAFLAGTDWHAAPRTVIAGDASNRRYERLTLPDGRTTILMDAPPDKGEDVRPFIRIARHLRHAGLSAPEIFGADDDNGFLLLEDLGDDVFARVLERTPGMEHQLYAAAVDVLLHLHQTPTPDLPNYGPQMTDLAALAYDWYQFGIRERVSGRAEFVRAFSERLRSIQTGPQVLIQRDYHAENLLWLPNREGVARVGLLDFQDALLGHPAYDLVSILQDARRDVSPALEAQMVARFLSNSDTDPDAFKTAYAVLSLQRNLRILGVFARLSMAYGKAHYVDLIPRVWLYVERTLALPGFEDLAEILLNDLPPPTKQHLEKLKSQCGQHPLP